MVVLKLFELEAYLWLLEFRIEYLKKKQTSKQHHSQQWFHLQSLLKSNKPLQYIQPKRVNWFGVHLYQHAFLVIQTVKNPPAMPEMAVSIPGSGRCPRGGHGYPLQYSGLENPIDRGTWRGTVHGVTKSQTRLRGWAHTHIKHATVWKELVYCPLKSSLHNPKATSSCVQWTQNFFSALFFIFWGFREVVRVGEVSILAPLYTIPLSGGKLASSCMPLARSAWLSILTCPNPQF